MMFLDDMIKGGLGLLAGATSSAPYGGKAFEGMIDADTRRDMAGRSLDRAEGWASGEKPLWSTSTVSRLTKGPEAELEGAATAGRARAGERAIQRGEGPRSKMLDKRLSEIDRSLIDAKRRQKGPLLAQLTMQEPEYRMRSQAMMFPWLQASEAMNFEDWARLEQMKAAKKAAGSQLHRALAGAAGAFGGGGGMFGSNPGYGQAQGGGGTPRYDYGSYETRGVPYDTAASLEQRGQWTPTFDFAAANGGSYQG